jgi:arsenical pump membrane protein
VVLPWDIVPFVLGMFCVVEGLNANGWVDRLAAWLVGGLGGSVWGALFGVGGLSLLLANVINNQVSRSQFVGLTCYRVRL